jgi:ribosomal subunit interface protein
MLDGGMQLPMTITFRNMSPSPAIEADVQEKAAKFETFFDRITSARVVIEAPHRGHRHGKLYHVRIDLRVPGREIVVSRDPAARHTHEDVYVAIRDAFDEAKRQLQDHAKAIRVGMKTHEPAARAQVTRLHPDEGYGFIETPDGREIYFHRNSVVGGDFERLQVGSEVRFVEELGERGPQASTVHPAGIPNTSKENQRVRA